MKIGFIGLGRMGFPMVQRLMSKGHAVVAFNRSPDRVDGIKRHGAIGTYSVDELLGKLTGQKIVWVMLPAGEATDAMIKELLKKLDKNDIIIDGANDFYEHAEKHAAWCAKKKVHFFDIGVSGGVWGLQNGYTLLVGGPAGEFKTIEPLCISLAPAG